MATRITSVLIGISFRKAFRILDDTGAIFDKLLYENGEKYFDAKYFPRIEYGGFEKGLRNDETGNYLKLTSDNVVYCHHISKCADEDPEIQAVIERVNKAIVPFLIEEYRLEISRIGMVFTVDVDNKKLDRFKNKFFKDNVDVSAFRFSIPSATPAGIREKDSQDYYNTIYTISREGDKYVISFDFQEYFKPLKPSWRECRADAFFAKARQEFADNLVKELE